MEIEREFTINGFAKPITVKDMRSGDDDQSLQDLGIVTKLQAGLETRPGGEANTFSDVIERGLVVVVEETSEYTRFKAYSGNKLGANFDYLLTTEENITGRLTTQFNTMQGMEPDPVAKVMPVAPSA